MVIDFVGIEQPRFDQFFDEKDFVGLVGGFTTFSTFAYQALENHAALSAVYVTSSVGLGIAAVALGRAI